MNLDKEQAAATYATEKRVMVIARAGSGKTTCLTERLRWIIKNASPNENIVAITFTNLAAEEMRSRLEEVPDNVYIGTIHAYANHLLVKNKIQTTSIIQKEQFDKLFELIKLYPEIIEPVEHLLIDEFQDTSKKQWSFIEQLKPSNLFVIGDDAQSIFSFNGSDVNFFRDLAFHSSFKVYKLVNNYRSGVQIVQFAQKFLLGDRFVIPSMATCNLEHSSRVLTIEYKLQEMLEFFMKVKNRNACGDWFILVRTNNEIQNIASHFDRLHIPYCTFKKSELTKAEMEEILHSDKIKLLTVHTSKGLESPNVWVQHFFPREKADETARLKYVAASRAQDNLIWNYVPANKRSKKW